MMLENIASTVSPGEKNMPAQIKPAHVIRTHTDRHTQENGEYLVGIRAQARFVRLAAAGGDRSTI